MIEDIDRILLEEATILQRLDVLAREITLDYQGKELTVISLLNGSFIFMADLLRRIP
jgi:hypoxanthine phosphoribosyltransferase